MSPIGGTILPLHLHASVSKHIQAVDLWHIMSNMYASFYHMKEITGAVPVSVSVSYTPSCLEQTKLLKFV